MSVFLLLTVFLVNLVLVFLITKKKLKFVILLADIQYVNFSIVLVVAIRENFCRLGALAVPKY